MILKRVKRELAYYRALLTHPRTPVMSRLLLAGAIAYFVSPIDLIPDFIPVFGQLAWGELLVMEHVIAVPVQPEQAPPELIMGRGLMSQDQLVSFFMEQNPDADEQKVARLAALYIEESAFEGVNADVAFIQMCLETGFLRFGGLVTEDMNNFCGLGAVSSEQSGLVFPDERTGVRAHVQHLKAYGSPDPLAGDLVDPRYQYVNPKGKSPDIQGLAGTWAADRQYGEKLADLLERLY